MTGPLKHSATPIRASADRAASVMQGALTLLDPGPRPLVIDEASGRIEAVLGASGAGVEVWLRRAGGTHPAAAWPPSGPFTSAMLRLPKAKDALDLALHAAASVVPEGAPIAVFGANDEGIRSAGRRLDLVADAVMTVDRRRHCRVLVGRRRAVIGGLKPALADWRRETAVTFGGEARRWVSYPGVFAGGALDEGTALLLDHLPRLAPEARVLDFGCGTGIIAAHVLQWLPRVQTDLLDADALALQAAGENVPGATRILADRLEAVGTTRYDAIVSNPPIHDGVAEHHGALEHLVADAPKRLHPGGLLQIVVQRRIAAADLIHAAFGNVETLAQNGRYRVLRARKEK